MKKIFCVLLCVAFCFLLTGCKFPAFNTEKLLSPPQLSGELGSIQKALVDSVKGEYTLKYPSSGDIKSAVVTEDVDNDGLKEAFVFYSVADKESTQMHINVMIKDEKGYKSVDDSFITASGIERIDFYDLDEDGSKEIIVGFEIYGDSEKQLAVYGFKDKILTQMMLQKYSNYLCVDLDGDKKTEVLIQELDAKESVNKAGVYAFSENGISQIAGCLMDGKVKTVEKFKLSALSNGQPAVYVDEIKGIGAVTEVLFMQKGELKNPLLDKENTMENIKTVRPSTIASADINDDGIIEIPVASDMPCADKDASEKLFYTNWCSFGGEALTVKQVSLVNVSDEYSINLPKRFIGKISVSKDIEKRTRDIFSFDEVKKETKEMLLSFEAMDKSDYEKNEDKYKNCKRVFSKDDTVVVVWETGLESKTTLTDKEFDNILTFNSF